MVLKSALSDAQARLPTRRAANPNPGLPQVQGSSAPASATSIFLNPTAISIEIDAHDPLAINTPGFEPLFKYGLVLRLDFRQHPAADLAGDTATNGDPFRGKELIHQFTTRLLGQAGGCVSCKIERHRQ